MRDRLPFFLPPISHSDILWQWGRSYHDTDPDYLGKMPSHSDNGSTVVPSDDGPCGNRRWPPDAQRFVSTHPGARLNRSLPRKEETMRLSEARIKQAILSPELDIRQRAMRYFSVCHSNDEGVVPLVIQAVEKYGREDAYQAKAPIRSPRMFLSMNDYRTVIPVWRGSEWGEMILARVAAERNSRNAV
jgi:hypothetical protein